LEAERMAVVIVVVLIAAAAVVGGLVGARLTRSRAVRDLQALVTQLDPGEPAPGGEQWDNATGRLERVLGRARTGADRERESVHRLAAAIDALAVGVVVADGEGAVVLRNSAAGHFAGAHHADALVLDAVSAMLRTALAGTATDRTLELYGPPRRTVVVRAAPFAGGALAVIEDVTERTRLEAMRTDFVANISHELKTPVGALALLAETLVGEDDTEVVGRLAERMVLESHRVGRIIEDLLELSRIEDGAAPVREVVGVGLLASEALERVRQLSNYRGIRIDVDEPARRLAVLGERRQLVSALANLIENGVKYSDPASTVHVAAALDPTGEWVDLVVRDHGIGIPQRDLERIFERFYRVDRARSRDTGGTGLGLAIVRHVATNHGGRVTVQSQEGLGSTFTLRVPAGPRPESPQSPAANRTEASAR